MEAFVFGGIAIAGLFVFFILFRKNRKRADYLLAAINLITIGFLVMDLLVREQLTAFRFLLQAILPNWFFPVFLLFSLEIMQGKNLQRKIFPIFLPAITTTIYIGFDLFLISDYDQADLLQLYNSPPVIYHVLYKGNQILFIIVLGWLLKKLRTYRREIKESFSFTDPIQLNWLTHFIWIYMGITLISFASFVISNLNLLLLNVQGAYAIVSGSLVLAIFYVSFHGIRQYTIAEYYGKQDAEIPTQINASDDKVSSLSNEKYKTSSLTQKEQETIYQQLITLFEEKAVYREPKLQLQDVARALGVSTHDLSQTINTIAGKPFYDFVNSYRVALLKKLLEDPAQRRFTILALGMDSGFNSKASLNRIFKDSVGLSPSEYQGAHISK